MTSPVQVSHHFDGHTARFAEYLWAERPSAALCEGNHLTFADLGNALFRATATRYLPVAGDVVLGQYTLAIGIAPSFTGTVDGAIVFGTALSRAIDGFYYYDTDTIVDGQEAGFYWTDFSSTTAAVVSNNTYTPAAGVIPVRPAADDLVAFEGDVPGGAGVTTEVVLGITALPDHLLGPNGTVTAIGQFETANTEGAKTVKAKLGSTVFASLALESVAAQRLEGGFANAGAETAQLTRPGASWGAGSTAAPTAMGVDTTAAQTITYTAQLATATDWLVCTQATIMATPRA